MTKAKAQELYRPSEVTAPQQMSSPSNARNTITDPSVAYLAPQFQKKFEQVAETTMQEIHRAWDRSLGRIAPSQRADQSSLRKKKRQQIPQNQPVRYRWRQKEVASDRHPKGSQYPIESSV